MATTKEKAVGTRVRVDGFEADGERVVVNREAVGSDGATVAILDRPVRGFRAWGDNSLIVVLP